MSERRAAFISRFAFGKDPLDDPLNAGWDAVVRHEPTDPSAAGAEDVVLLRRVYALEAASRPSPTFFSDLEQQLARMYSATIAEPDRSPGARSSRPASARPALGRREFPRRSNRRLSMQSALAVLSVVVIASLFILYRAVPGPSEPPPIPAATIDQPTLDTVVQFDSAAALPGLADATEWTQMEFSIIVLDPGMSFTTNIDWYTSVDGPLLLMVISGEFTIQPAGPALFYPGDQRNQLPTEISAGETVPIEPNDAIVYSAVDAAAGSNPGSEPTVALLGSVGNGGDSFKAGPTDVRRVNYDFIEFPAPLPASGATVSIKRLELLPFDSYVFEPGVDWTYLPILDQIHLYDLRISNGAVAGLSPDVALQRLSSSSDLRYLDPSPHTIFNLGDQTVDIYFLVLEPLPSTATPPA